MTYYITPSPLSNSPRCRNDVGLCLSLYASSARLHFLSDHPQPTAPTHAWISCGFVFFDHTGFNLNAPGNLSLTTAALSNLIGNSATVMLLLKVVNLAAPAAPYILALANSFGGSLIIIGSVSNIIVVQQAREMGIKISFWDFARLGIPVTLAALVGLLIWVALAR
jgi:hypothetical protein